MGVNGAGKSTLLKLVAGEAAPDAGTVTLGASVKLGYFAQHAMELLDGDDSVWETLQSAFPHASIGSLRTLAGAFGFSGDDVEKRCRVLSGGEKARLVLARMLYDPPNFLVLDEPTNHLDLATKEMLIRALADFDGTMLFVSHDRHFLAALSNRVLELAPEGRASTAAATPSTSRRAATRRRGCGARSQRTPRSATVAAASPCASSPIARTSARSRSPLRKYCASTACSARSPPRAAI